MGLDLRKEALLNEYKGNLFEFLVGISFAREFKLERAFLDNLNPGFSHMLKQQESYLRSFYPDLIVRLPALSESLKKEIVQKLDISTLDSISLVGKSAASTVGGEIAEGDILLTAGEITYPISIKLNKYSSATNTKSAGVKSFFSKYFKDSYLIQDKLNLKIDQLFDEFSFALHSEYGLEWDRNFNEWVMRGLPTLPGELTGKGREIYLKLIYSISEAFYEETVKLKKDNAFFDSIFSLIGFSNPNIVQATCFHKKEYTEFINEVLLKNTDLSKTFKLSNKSDTSYFDIKLDGLVLQVRIKAMNKFINKSFKVNCSVKYTKSS